LFVTFIDVLKVWRCPSFCVIETVAHQCHIKSKIRRLRSTMRVIVAGAHHARLSQSARSEEVSIAALGGSIHVGLLPQRLNVSILPPRKDGC